MGIALKHKSPVLSSCSIALFVHATLSHTKFQPSCKVSSVKREEITDKDSFEIRKRRERIDHIHPSVIQHIDVCHSKIKDDYSSDDAEYPHWLSWWL
jgi:uncharacterized protein YdaT